ncbi:helix-turn-helix domain-containing protein [Beggiatoa leptomitoformis]|uniref:Helix-turn-helix domain-containing protein n=1 Tax=Beggiatoa leptomitoformis TaxID=288004 RepID=A0A2N9YCT1_9GAMM|nr:helix-turn-helix transcriptional regulator [Beggiatoa leptomitoformis]ALG66442.2 helix-turn-helix domain-containing protein [Beggiatoa leptomitoformis]AUI68279.2 helix-turn-helix domain-containing protein [Beggiatoa leptomitoformis]
MNEKIKTARKKAGLKQEELAMLAKIGRTTLSKIENCKQGISLVQLRRIANALKIDITELVKND